MSTIRSLFSTRFITSHFCSVFIVVRRFFTCTTLGDADLRFSLTLVRNANVAAGGNYIIDVIISPQRNQSIHVTDGVQ